MTDVLAPDHLAAAVIEAAAALTMTGLPVTGAPGPALDTSNSAPLAPGVGARAVVASLVGAQRARVVLALSATVAGPLENGPLGPQDLAAIVEAPLLDALRFLEAELGGPLHLEAAQSLDADLAVATAVEEANGSGAVLVAIPLLDGGDHVATLVVSAASAEPVVASVELPELDAAVPQMAAESGHVAATSAAADDLGLLSDVEMQVTVELGRTRLTVRELLALVPGAVVELDRAAGSVVDLFVNGTLVAKGEVVVVDEVFGIRVTEIVRRDQPGRPR